MENRASTATDLAELVRGNPELQAAVKQDPVETLDRLARPLESDPWIYRIIVLTLGIAIIGSVIAATLLRLADSGTQIPDLLVAIGTGSIGALAGLLAPRPGG
jgi:hypothetical protein